MEPINTYDSGTMHTSGALVEKESALLSSVFSWMMAGLLTTGFVGAWVMSDQALLAKVIPNIMIICHYSDSHFLCLRSSKWLDYSPATCFRKSRRSVHIVLGYRDYLWGNGPLG